MQAMGIKQSRNESREDHDRINRTVKEVKRITRNEVVKPISIVPVHLSIVSSLSLAFVLNNLLLMPVCTHFVRINNTVIEFVV